MRRLTHALLALLIGSCASAPSDSESAAATPTGAVQATPPTPRPYLATSDDRRARLASVMHWFYYLDFDPQEAPLQRIAESAYDLIVLEPLFTEREQAEFPIADLVAKLHAAPHSKLVIAYLNVGQAEAWRSYWQPSWRVGHPVWIVGEDPDGWEGNYPVAYWHEEWKKIWLSPMGILPAILAAGFDGVYLDWVEAYSDENVLAAARRDGVIARAEMIRWVGELASFARARQPDFLVITQNAAELIEDQGYLAVIDAVAQEHTWFDGGPDNHPPGDCPLPRAEADVESNAYVESLSPVCRRVYERFPESTLHVSSEWYLRYLTMARAQGAIVLTVDYAQDVANVAWVVATSRALGFVPLVSERGLSVYLDPAP